MGEEPPKQEEVIVYSIRLKSETGELEMNTSTVHNDFIVWLSKNGGETKWNPSLVKAETTDHVMCLVDIGILKKIDLIGQGDVFFLKLTDLGVRAADAIRKHRGITG